MTTTANFYRADHSVSVHRMDGRFGTLRLISACLEIASRMPDFAGYEIVENGEIILASDGAETARHLHAMHRLLERAGCRDIQFDTGAGVVVFVDCYDGVTRQASFENVTEESINGPYAWSEVVVDVETDAEAEKRDYTNREYRRMISRARAKADKEIPSITSAVSDRIRLFTDTDSFRLNSMSVY